MYDFDSVNKNVLFYEKNKPNNSNLWKCRNLKSERDKKKERNKQTKDWKVNQKK